METRNRTGRGRGFGLVVGFGLGLVFALLFRKPGIAILIGLLVAYIIYTWDKKR